MNVSQTTRIFFLFVGGFIGGFIIGTFFGNSKDESVSSDLMSSDLKQYDDSLSLLVKKDVKLLCWVFTHPANHHSRSIHVKNTWGQRCNKLIFMSSSSDPLLPEIVEIPAANDRSQLWKKTQLVYRYVS
jgi:hypothetical protein